MMLFLLATLSVEEITGHSQQMTTLVSLRMDEGFIYLYIYYNLKWGGGETITQLRKERKNLTHIIYDIYDSRGGAAIALTITIS